MNLVVNALIKVLDENVTLTSLTKRGITLRPHNAAYQREIRHHEYQSNKQSALTKHGS